MSQHVNNVFPKRRVNGEIIGSKRNHVKYIKKKRLATIVKRQQAKDTLVALCKTIKDITDTNKSHTSPVIDPQLVTSHHVNPKGDTPRSIVITIT